MDPVPPKVTVVLPSREAREVEALATSCRRKALVAGLTHVAYRAETGRVTGTAECERPLQLLEPNDAYELYQALHRSPVLVLAFTAVFARRDPSTMPAVRRHLLTLEAFVRHKAVYALARSERDVKAAFESFARWRRATFCDGENDPRILPLHSFETDRDWVALGTAAGDEEFRGRHGPPARRIDDSGKVWARPLPGAYHAPDLQIVAGRRLEDGMHWDVNPGDRHAGRLLAPNQVWKLTGGKAYLNAYPDAYVRAAKSAIGVRLVWSAPARARSR